ncbi:MAG: potassium channel family protein [Acidimicrobiales bacterium]
MVNPWLRVFRGLCLLGLVVLIGFAGYLAFGFSPLDALYQTVITIFTVGFREVHPFSAGEKVFTIALILGGVGSALYTFGVLLETLVEGRLSETMRRHRMQRQIEQMSGHVIICGWGRVGRTVAQRVVGYAGKVVVVDNDPERLEGIEHPYVLGDATDDDVMWRAGIGSAATLVAALTSDADNLFVTLSGRSLNQNLFIVARARLASADDKLLRAGANRVVNPQEIGGARMAAFTFQPNVAEFLDVVMHDGSLEFRLAEVTIPEGSPLAGCSLRDSHLRDQTGALVLALRHVDGTFTTNPDPDFKMIPEQVLILIGTKEQLEEVDDAVRGGGG